MPVQLQLFEDLPEEKKIIKQSEDFRNDPMFLRNQFSGDGKYGIPIVKKQSIDLGNIKLIACTNTITDEKEYLNCGVHFFVDDIRFDSTYSTPGKKLSVFSQYRFCCTPDFSVYGEMQTWRQIESVSHSRWVGAFWQSNNMTVIPTISWDKYNSYDFCFDGIEEGSIVVVSTYGCHNNRMAFLKGYDAMIEKINPEAIICYGNPFLDMKGNIISVPIEHPKQFHRHVKR